MEVEHVFLRVHMRVSSALSAALSPGLRLTLQTASLALVAGLAVVLTYLHVHYASVRAPAAECLAEVLRDAVQSAEARRPVDLLAVRVWGPASAWLVGLDATRAAAAGELEGLAAWWPSAQARQTPQQDPDASLPWRAAPAVYVSPERGLLELSEEARRRLNLNWLEVHVDARWPVAARPQDAEAPQWALRPWNESSVSARASACLAPAAGAALLDLFGAVSVPVANAAVRAFDGRGFVGTAPWHAVAARAQLQRESEAGASAAAGAQPQQNAIPLQHPHHHPEPAPIAQTSLQALAHDALGRVASRGVVSGAAPSLLFSGHGGGTPAAAGGSSWLWVQPLAPAADVARMSVGFSTWVAFKVGTLCSAAFLLFAASSLVSFVLSETQRRMLSFTVALQHAVRTRRPLGMLVLSHSLDSLVFVPMMLGVLFFMFEYFADQLLASCMLLAVWAAEIYSVVGCRTIASIRVFPRVFLLSMTWFLAYYFAFPFGFHALAFLATAAGLLSTMLHLWVHYELPALESGAISERSPRQIRLILPDHLMPTSSSSSGRDLLHSSANSANSATSATSATHSPTHSPTHTPTTPSPPLGPQAPQVRQRRSSSRAGVPPRPLPPQMLATIPADAGTSSAGAYSAGANSRTSPLLSQSFFPGDRATHSPSPPLSLAVHPPGGLIPRVPSASLLTALSGARLHALGASFGAAGAVVESAAVASPPHVDVLRRRRRSPPEHD